MSTSNPIDAVMSQPVPPAAKFPVAAAPSASAINPIDQAMSGSAKADSAAPRVAENTSAPSVSINPIDQILGIPAKAPNRTPEPAPQPSVFTMPAASSNPIDRIMGVSTQSSLTDKETEVSKPLYERTWDWLNEPLFGDPHRLGVREGASKFESGVEEGLEDIAGGMTTPLSLGLLAATFGGSAVETVGIRALGMLGVSRVAAPIVTSAAKSLITLGFSAQMVSAFATQSPQFLEALKAGDVEGAARLGTNLAATGFFLKESLKHGIQDARTARQLFKGENLTVPEKLAVVTKIAGEYDVAKAIGDDSARAKKEEIDHMLKEANATDSVTQAGIRHLITQGGDLERIQKMIDITEGKAKVLEGISQPREYTTEEKDAFKRGAELRTWASKSHDITKNTNGSPKTLYVTDSADGTHKLGQTLSEYGNEADAHFVQIKKPYTFPSSNALYDFIIDNGGEEATKKLLQDKGYDGIVYNSESEGEENLGFPSVVDTKYITFQNDQYRPVERLKQNSTPWNRDYVYAAVDGKYRDQVLNSGIKSPRAKEFQYYDSPEKAIYNATRPEPGSALAVFAIPRSEVEAGIHNENVAYRVRDVGEKGVPSTSHSQATMSLAEAQSYLSSRESVQGKPQEIVAIPLKGHEYNTAPGPNGHSWIKFANNLPESAIKQLSDVEDLRSAPISDFGLITKRSHIPAYEIKLDENNKPVMSTPLRAFGAGNEGLPEDNSRFNNQYTLAEKEQYLAGLRKALSLTEEQKNVATTLRGLYDNSFLKANEAGLIRSWLEAYHPSSWANEKTSMWKYLFNRDTEPVTSATKNEYRHAVDSGYFDTNLNAAKHRAYSLEFAGVMAGEKFLTDDLSLHAFNHLRGIDRALAARKFIDTLRQKGATASDGRPAAVLAGSSRVFGDQKNPAVAINPDAVKSIAIPRETIENWDQQGTLKKRLDDGLIVKLPWSSEIEEHGEMRKIPVYAWSSEGYESIDHPALRGWGYAGQDTAGNPAMLQGDIKIHPYFSVYVRRVVGAEKSGVREFLPIDTPLGKTSVGEGLLRVGQEAKGALLFGSPFHIGQIGLRALMVGIKPWDFSHIDISDVAKNPEAELLQLGVREGLIRSNYKARDAFSEGYAGHSKLISKIPGLNRYQDWMNSFLFEKMIPGLKDRGFIKIFNDLRAANPELTREAAADKAADLTNDLFGGLNWRKLGVSASNLDLLRLSALAPDWLLSELRMVARSAGAMDKETEALSQKMMLKQLLGIWLTARVVNAVFNNGNFHNETPFGLAVKKDDGTETVYSMRSLPLDVMHALSDPENFIKGRMAPITTRPAVEYLSGRNEQGRRVTEGQQAADLVRNVIPIPVQGLIKGGPLSGTEQLGKAGGLAIYKYKSPAEQLIQQYSSDHNENGPVEPGKLAAHQRQLVLQDAFLQGKISRGDLLQQVSKREADQIVKIAHMTPWQARFYRLPVSEEVNIFDVATADEKAQVYKILEAKINSWMKDHAPAERVHEPEWRKIQSLQKVRF